MARHSENVMSITNFLPYLTPPFNPESGAFMWTLAYMKTADCCANTPKIHVFRSLHTSRCRGEFSARRKQYLWYHSYSAQSVKIYAFSEFNRMNCLMPLVLEMCRWERQPRLGTYTTPSVCFHVMTMVNWCLQLGFTIVYTRLRGIQGNKFILKILPLICSEKGKGEGKIMSWSKQKALF